MARRTSQELIKSLTAIVGENDSEEYTALMEDIADSVNNDSEDWRRRYEENDAQWRNRYRERFTSPEKREEERRYLDDMERDHEEEGEEITRFEQLFEEE